MYANAQGLLMTWHLPLALADTTALPVAIFLEKEKWEIFISVLQYDCDGKTWLDQIVMGRPIEIIFWHLYTGVPARSLCFIKNSGHSKAMP